MRTLSRRVVNKLFYLFTDTFCMFAATKMCFCHIKPWLYIFLGIFQSLMHLLAPNCVWERYYFHPPISPSVYLFCRQYNSKTSLQISMKFGSKFVYNKIKIMCENIRNRRGRAQTSTTEVF